MTATQMLLRVYREKMKDATETIDQSRTALSQLVGARRISGASMLAFHAYYASFYLLRDQPQIRLALGTLHNWSDPHQ